MRDLTFWCLMLVTVVFSSLFVLGMGEYKYPDFVCRVESPHGCPALLGQKTSRWLEERHAEKEKSHNEMP